MRYTLIMCRCQLSQKTMKNENKKKEDALFCVEVLFLHRSGLLHLQTTTYKIFMITLYRKREFRQRTEHYKNYILTY